MRDADVVFRGGVVFDGSGSAARSGTVAVRDGRIIAVDRDLDRDLIGSATEVVDLDGGMVLPGFVDAHVHPVEGGLERRACDLSEGHTRDQYLATIEAYARAHPDAEWIVGGGWHSAAFPGGTPLAADLDRVVPDRPVFLSNRDHHGAWVNSAALKRAGLDRDTPDPDDGRLERDADGNPSGTLHEGARLLVHDLIPRVTDEENRLGLLEGQRYLHSFGVTSWQDAIVGEYGSHTDTGDVYLAAAQSGELTARVVAALWWDRHSGLEQLDHLRARRAALRHEKFVATSVKIMQDGIPENRTAALLDPYLAPGCTCGTERGLAFLERDELIAAVHALDADDFQVHVHAIGDRAVRDALDAFESVPDRLRPGAPLHHIAHLQIVHPDDVARFATIGVAANMQALWATFEPQMVELNLPSLGPERAAWQYPFAGIARSGALLCAGSDWPVTTPDPWAALHVAVNRRLPEGDPDFDPRPFYPEQALDLGTALKAYTAGSARINSLNGTGTIAVGAVADLVVVDRDPFAGPADEIASTTTSSTWVGGQRVYGD
ncbi:amidohydrolase [Herbiconiux sp. L3-i23]|uniref:amidohydrolase n=1 Tax=Herbiconiux sp. L3-i23 TaxID=2905871 RepID=UPI002062DBFD|nr:amidohydrolase [Herbiconiux sp. L3-i23]BDI23220.1 amidohydrolase [Herbiconiux sp. L3-i23]